MSIKVPSKYTIVKAFDRAIVLSEFDVTASTDCSSDYVTVTTGDPAQVLETSEQLRLLQNFSLNEKRL